MQYIHVYTADKTIWTTGAVNFEAWALSRYDAKFLYDKMPTVTELSQGKNGFWGDIGS